MGIGDLSPESCACAGKTVNSAKCARLLLHYLSRLCKLKFPVEERRSTGYHGEVSEWLKELVSKTSVLVRVSRVRISPSPLGIKARQVYTYPFYPGEVQEWLNWHAWKVCERESVPWVRIPPSPLYMSQHVRATLRTCCVLNRPATSDQFSFTVISFGAKRLRQAARYDVVPLHFFLLLSRWRIY